MPQTTLRTLGVHGKNAPTKQTNIVQAADFGIGGIIGLFERKYLVPFLCRNPQEELAIFGDYFSSIAYGKDTTKLFWNNLKGQAGKLYVKAHVGFNGSAIDAVVAAATLTDQNGLQSTVARANDLRTKMNAHAADVTEHATADSTNFPLGLAAAQDLAGLIALVNKMIDSYAAHEADAALASAWAFHFAQETGTHALASTAHVTDLASAITAINDIYTKYNAHDADATAHHGGGSLHQASSSSASASAASTLKIQPAYQGTLEYGVGGNRTGYTIENGVRFATTLAAVMGTGDVQITLASVVGMAVGDFITIYASGATPGVSQKKITVIDEANKKISFAASTGLAGLVGDVVEVPGFRIHTWRKSLTGVVAEVSTDLGKIWCTMAPEVTQFYAPTVHALNNYITVTDLSSSSGNVEKSPNEQPTVAFLSSGADGTVPTTSAHWGKNNSSFDGLPVRFIANCETADTQTVKDLETYAAGRDDTPVVIARLPENQTQTQLQTSGASYQRSNDVFQVNVADWVFVTDPYNSAPNAPYRAVPNVGLVMGAWIQSIAVSGVHVIPSTGQITLSGIQGVENSNLNGGLSAGNVSDAVRTQLAQYGINLIQFVNGSGYMIRNLFTPSTNQAFMFANAILMRNFIKVSSEESLQGSENTPNSFNRINSDRNAIQGFMLRLWDVGSTGNAPTGETFGRQQLADGTLTKFEDHVQVIADPINNPQSSINLGQRNLDVFFTFPAPAGSIQISVGVLIR